MEQSNQNSNQNQILIEQNAWEIILKLVNEAQKIRTTATYSFKHTENIFLMHQKSSLLCILNHII